MELKVKTSREKAKIKLKKRLEKCTAIVNRLKELEVDYSKSDAVAICANEFSLSLPTIYKAKRDYDKITTRHP